MPLRRRALRRVWTVCVVVALLGCAEAVQTQRYPGLEEPGLLLRRVAVAPLRASGELARATPRDGDPDAAEAVALMARFLAEALAERGVDVVPADDVRRALPSPAPTAPRAVAEVVAREFGVGAVLTGEVMRFRRREGEAIGSLRPASVAFSVTLYRAPGGERLWTGLFDETQKSLNENLFNAARYPGGGTRWLTVEEIGRWGAREVAEALPASQ